MGLLDDAIKEHLELKRKHGAPEEEVQRQEEEALGPVRREAAQQPESVETEAEAAATDGEGTVAEAGVVAETAAPGGGEQLFDGEAQPTKEPAPVEDVEPVEEPAAEAPAFDEPPVAEEAPAPEVSAADEPVPDPEAPEPVADPGDTPPRGVEPAEDEPRSADPGATVEYDPFADEELEEDEEPAASDDEGEGEGDVLEDTPDFLQETPEHDRLWFEQKPPRDFDFE
jgi:hypothetical protein